MRNGMALLKAPPPPGARFCEECKTERNHHVEEFRQTLANDQWQEPQVTNVRLCPDCVMARLTTSYPTTIALQQIRKDTHRETPAEILDRLERECPPHIQPTPERVRRSLEHLRADMKAKLAQYREERAELEAILAEAERREAALEGISFDWQ